MSLKWKMIGRRGLGLLCTVLLLCSLAVNASAAEKELTVEINGKTVDFTDAFPENHNNRNFLPFAAIFEALGAELYYDHSTYTGYAYRGDTVVEVLIGTNQLSVTRNGQREEIEMDVASYTKNNRTYVPVGYMAQALGFRAEWDQEHVTIILIDTETMVEEALREFDYTLLEECRAMLEQYGRGNWCVEGLLEYALSYGETTLAMAEAEYSGLLSADGKSQIFLAMDADYSVWYRAQAAARGMSLEELGVGWEELYPILVSETRSDAAAGTSYLYVTRATGMLDTLLENTWLTDVPQAAISGMELSTLLDVGGQLDAGVIVRSAMAELDLTDSTTAMEVAGNCAAEMAKALSDDAAVETEGGLTLSWIAGGVENELFAALDAQGSVSAVNWKQSAEVNGVRTTTQTSADRQGTVICTTLVESDGQSVYVAQGGTYTATDEEPVTTLPEGVKAVSCGG